MLRYYFVLSNSSQLLCPRVTAPVWLPLREDVSDTGTVSVQRQQLERWCPAWCWCFMDPEQSLPRSILCAAFRSKTWAPALSRRHHGSLGWRRGLAGERCPDILSTLGLLGARGVHVRHTPCLSQGPAADHPGTRTKKSLVGLQPSGDGSHAIQCSPALQTRFRWSGGMMSCLLCPGWRVARRKQAGGPAAGGRSFQPSRFFPQWHTGQTLCTKHCVSKSSRTLDASLQGRPMASR